MLGTPGYMAPEQARGDPVAASADVFALGSVLFECLTGAPLHAATNLWGIIGELLFGERRRARRLRPELPPVLDALVARMLAQEPLEQLRRTGGAGGVVLTDPLTAELLDGRFLTEPAGDGIARLTGALPILDEGRLLLGKPTPCVGRERELTLLEGLVEACRGDARPRAILITAPPGIGKSRLRQELARRLRARDEPVTTLIARGDAMAPATPYAMAAQLVCQLVDITPAEPLAQQSARLQRYVADRVAPDLVRDTADFLAEICQLGTDDTDRPHLRAARQDPRIMRDQIMDAWVTLMGAASAARPLLLILDDLHWGDALTIGLVDATLRSRSPAPLLVLALARPEIDELFPALWHQRGCDMLRLAGLGRSACEQLVQIVLDATPAVAAQIAERSTGNALYLEELIRAASLGRGDDAPETVIAMLQARFMLLSPAQRRVLRLGSVFGQRFWRNGILALSIDPDDDDTLDALLHQLVDAEIIEPQRSPRFAGETEYVLRHALYRDAAYGMLTEKDRSLGHRLAGQWLEQHGERDALSLAEHFERGEDRGRAAQHYLRAADRASEADDADAILSCVERGLGCSPAGELRAALLSLRAGVLLEREQYAESIALATEALEGLAAGSRRWSMTFVTLHATVAVSQPGALMNLARRFLDVLPSPEARDEYLQAAVWLHVMLAIVGEKGVAHELLLRMRREGVHISKDDASAWGSVKGAEASHHHYIQEAPWSCMRANAEAARSLAQAGRWDRGISATVYGNALTDLGDQAGAASVLQESLALAERRRDAFSLALARVYLARLLARVAPLERLTEPEHLARAVIAAGNPMMVGLAHGVLAQLAVRRGDLATAEAEARIACERVRPFPTYSWDITALRAQILLSLGRAQEALDAGEEALERLSRLGVSGHGEIDLCLAVAEARDATGRTEEGRTLLREMLPRLRHRVDNIPSAEARARYLTEIPIHARLLSVAREWLGDEALRDAGLVVEAR